MAGERMTVRHILMAAPSDQSDLVKPLISKIDPSLELVAVGDGAHCITAHAKLCKAKLPPLVVLISEQLDHVNGPQVALTIRKVERSLGVAPSAIIYVTDTDDDAERVRRWGRAVNLTKKASDTPKQAAVRTARAVARVLSQLSKRGKQ